MGLAVSLSSLCCMRHSTKILSFYLVYELNTIFPESIAVASFLPFSFSNQELNVPLPVTITLCISFIFPDLGFCAVVNYVQQAQLSSAGVWGCGFG